MQIKIYKVKNIENISFLGAQLTSEVNVRERFYTEGELKGALIYDSEGLYYGEAGRLILKDEQAYLEVYIRRKVGEVVVDDEALKRKLAAKGVAAPPDAVLEELIVLAREGGLEVPRKIVEKTVSLKKAMLPCEEIRWIDVKELRAEPYFGKTAVIFLKTPREARYRGQHASPPPKVPKPELVRGRLVLSETKGILGVAWEVAVGFGELGLRVYRIKGAEKKILWLAFITHLRKEGMADLAAELSEEIDPYRSSRLDLGMKDKIVAKLSELGAIDAVRLLDNFVEEGEEESLYVDVPWRKARKLGDAIIVE